VQVSKWGNSLAIRLPVAVVEVLGLKEGDDVEVTVTGEHQLELGRAPDNRAILARLRQYRGTLPADFKFDRLETYGDRG
jgi:antitoxin MazE